MGFSYYPYWVQMKHDEEKLTKDMTALADRYCKPLMLAEIVDLRQRKKKPTSFFAAQSDQLRQFLMVREKVSFTGNLK